jgi:ATP-dependent Clp protease ATP-binding subunit ClpA
MFERFTNTARRIVVLSQEEARRLNHNYIGTEHLLLALLNPDTGSPAQQDEGADIPQRVLGDLGMSLADTRHEIIGIVGLGKRAPDGHIPFTPRAKKSLEYSLREALALKNNYIGSQHILLGLIQEGTGVAAQVMTAHAGDLLRVRLTVLDLAPRGRDEEHEDQPASGRRGRGRAVRVARALRLGELGVPGPFGRPAPGAAGRAAEAEEAEEDLHTTPAAGASLQEAARLAGSAPIGSHHLLLAALADPNAAAARTLAGLGLDLDRARTALAAADLSGTSDESPRDAGRRQMSVTEIDGGVVVRATDEVLVGLAREALRAVGDPESGGAIYGDQAIGASLGDVWQALHDSLADIRLRAGGVAAPEAADEADGPDAADEADGPAAAESGDE